MQERALKVRRVMGSRLLRGQSCPWVGQLYHTYKLLHAHLQIACSAHALQIASTAIDYAQAFAQEVMPLLTAAAAGSALICTSQGFLGSTDRKAELAAAAVREALDTDITKGESLPSQQRQVMLSFSQPVHC